MGVPSGAGAAASDRFHVIARLGEGGMGVVYRALDLVLGVEVALKVLSRSGGRDLYRFKREFRALADVAHPNLVRLQELFVAGDQWSFSMELIDGVPLGQHLRPPPPPLSPFTVEDDSTITSPGAAGFDRGRLADAFHQLADAVIAIHLLGKVHRDLKPSNVLVERGGRVVVLDFGLISDTTGGSVDRTHDAMAVGTPAYMSPEQARDEALGPASDWYSVGVMLYEALCGRRPFDGPAAEVMHRRSHEDPRPPRAIDPRVPEDLDRVCMALLARDPARRADGRALLEVLGRTPSTATRAIERLAEPTPFVGRARELDVLADAFAAAQKGASVFLPVTGPSGIGKTTLIRRFLDGLDPAQAMIFQARCYERETVPFQAMDSLVDAVATRLSAMTPAELERVVPRDLGALARLFPTLHRVPGLSSVGLPSLLPPDHVELRRRAVAAFGDLLAALAGPRTLVVFLDDLQWSDADAGALLAELVRWFEDGGALFMVASRGGDERGLPLAGADRGTPTVRLAGDTEPSAPSGLVLRELAIGPLPADDARALVRAIAPDQAPPSDEIAAEAAGVPFFVAELARAGADGAPRPTLARVIEDRIERVSADARALLDVCAVASRPLRLDIVAAVSDGDVAGALAELRTERLVQTERRGDHQLVELVHDQVRGAALAAIADDRRRAINARLAGALGGRDDTDPADLVDYWLAAGERAAAAEYAGAAARTAEDALAFHRAVELYELAIEAPELPADERRALRRRTAECLAAIGQLDAAIAVLVDAAADATGAERRALKRLEVEFALRVGDFERGIAEGRALCAELGYRIPKGRRATIAAIVAQELRLRLSGGRARKRTDELPPADQETIDTLWSLTSGLAYVQPGLGRLIQLYHLRAALASGEPARIARAVSLEPPHLAQGGTRVTDKLAAAEARAQKLIDEIDRPDLRGLHEASLAVSCGITARWRDAAEHGRNGERLLRDHLKGTRWALNIAQLYRVIGHWFLGDTDELVRLVPQYVAEAEEVGDAHGLGLMRAGRGHYYWLITDRPADARAMEEAGLPRRDRSDEFHLHDYFHALCELHILLYEGDVRRAHERVEQVWAAFSRSLVHRVQFLRIEASNLRARCAVAAAHAAGGAERDRLLELARRALADAADEQAPWSDALAASTRAALAHLAGRTDEAVALGERAVAQLQACELGLHAQAARWRHGERLGGSAGAEIIDDAATWMRLRKVADPARLVRILAV